MQKAWDIASVNFREDDGSLPSVEFDQLHAESVSRVYRFFRENGRCVSESPTVWDEKEQIDAPLLSVDDPCAWLQEGRTNFFYCCFGGISIDGTAIPDIGVFVFSDALALDFRMGKEWNPANVDAFFRMLAYIKSLAPEAKVKSSEQEGLVDEVSFMMALDLYLNEGGGATK